MSHKENQNIRKISQRMLSLRNGVDHKDIWVAYKSKVYDVSKSRLWFKGKHYEHWAGQDLTEELRDAPHTEEVFKRMVFVGNLED